MIRIYGHSDDNVELEETGTKPDSPGVPVWREEVGVDRLTLIVGGKLLEKKIGHTSKWSADVPGVRVVMRYASRGFGVWTAEVGPLDEDIPSLPCRVTARSYTVVVDVEAPEGVPVRAKFKGSKKLVNARDVKALNARNES